MEFIQDRLNQIHKEDRREDWVASGLVVLGFIAFAAFVNAGQDAGNNASSQRTTDTPVLKEHSFDNNSTSPLSMKGSNERS